MTLTEFSGDVTIELELDGPDNMFSLRINGEKAEQFRSVIALVKIFPNYRAQIVRVCRQFLRDARLPEENRQALLRQIQYAEKH